MKVTEFCRRSPLNFHMTSRLITSYQKYSGQLGEQGGHVGASNALPNDAVYEKAFVRYFKVNPNSSSNQCI